MAMMSNPHDRLQRQVEYRMFFDQHAYHWLAVDMSFDRVMNEMIAQFGGRIDHMRMTIGGWYAQARHDMEFKKVDHVHYRITNDYLITEPEGEDMKINSTESDRLREQAEGLKERAEQLDAFGDDEWPDGTVLSYDRQFPESCGRVHDDSPSYTYVFVKTQKGWYSTDSRMGYQLSWGTLVDHFIQAGVTPQDIYRVSGWSAIG